MTFGFSTRIIHDADAPINLLTFDGPFGLLGFSSTHLESDIYLSVAEETRLSTLLRERASTRDALRRAKVR